MPVAATSAPRSRIAIVTLTIAILAVAAAAWELMAQAPQWARTDLRRTAELEGSELTNRLRLADRVLRSIASDVAANGSNSAPLGSTERLYFESVTFLRPGETPIQMLAASATVPELTPLMQQTVARGESVLVTTKGQGQQPATVTLVRALAAPSSDKAILAARLLPAYLWPATVAGPAASGLCVRESGGVTLHCTEPAAWDASTALKEELARSGEGRAWAGSNDHWQAAATPLQLASPFAASPWAVLVIAKSTGSGASMRPRAVLGLGALGAVVLAGFAASALLRRRPARTGPGPSDAHAPAGAAQDGGSEPALADADVARKMQYQQHAIQAMADIDRASLAHAGVDRMLVLASGHLLQCTGCAAVVLTVLDRGMLNRMTVVLAHADGAEGSPEQRAVDPSIEQLLTVPTNGSYLQQLSGFALLEPLATGGSTSAFVLPIHQDGQPVGLIALGCDEIAGVGADESANARAIAVRLGVALTSSVREEALYAHTHFDATTALPNRQYLIEHLPQHMSRARRDGGKMVLLFVDLDGFKNVNRSAGHSRGDLVLAEAAARMRECVREEDLVTRFGGDEFVVVLPRVASGLDARRVADKLLVALALEFQIEDAVFQLGCSIGISIFPDDAQTVDTLLRSADSAMFDAKAAGRGRYAFYDATVNRTAIDRNALELELRRAITNEEFVVYYQPQIDLRNGRIDGVEALVRWNHPVRGLVSPFEFIGVAEQSGLIAQIGELVMLQACKQFHEWDELGIAPLRISVNVSSLEVTRGDLVARVDRVLSESGLRPMHLELELTEGVFLEESGDNLNKLVELRHRGVRIAVDDFGTGYSSLGYLRRLPIDVVKIDQTFVRELGSGKDASSIMQAILDVAHGLGKSVVAEGVETEQQRAQLLAMGCDVGQGYLWSRPLPAREFQAFCQEWRVLSRPVALETA